jgi:hypothetical protein
MPYRKGGLKNAMTDDFVVSFDQRSIAAIAQMYSFQMLLEPEVQAALKEAAPLLVEGARGAMSWQNPTGELSDSLHPVFSSPYEAQVGSNAPHARRRNWGFIGTDSVGRTYSDLGAYFMEKGMEEKQQEVLRLIDAGVERALERIGA